MSLNKAEPGLVPPGEVTRALMHLAGVMERGGDLQSELRFMPPALRTQTMRWCTGALASVLQYHWHANSLFAALHNIPITQLNMRRLGLMLNTTMPAVSREVNVLADMIGLPRSVGVLWLVGCLADEFCAATLKMAS